MTRLLRVRPSAALVLLALLTCGVTMTLAFKAPDKAGRFDSLVILDPSIPQYVTSKPIESLPATDAIRQRWEGFRASHAGDWRVALEDRTGAPLLVEGRGIAFVPGSGNALPPGQPLTVDALASKLQTFVGSNSSLLLTDSGDLRLNAAASGEIAKDVWLVVFDHVVAGVPVAGDRYQFAISHGNLVQFGASRWSKVTASPIPDVAPEAAFGHLLAYMGVRDGESYKVAEGAKLQYLPVRTVDQTAAYTGSVGNGYNAKLAWRVGVSVAGEPGTWVGLIDAHSGEILGFFDDDEYAQAKGGVFPVSNDGILPDGVEIPGYPMPFTNITIGASTTFASSSGSFACTPGGSSATTTLAGQYVKVADSCGAISKSVTCDNDLDMGGSAGTDCAVPAGGGGTGNTHSARSSFYHLNRIAEHGRSWLPGNAWLNSQLTDNVNLNQTCNAYWQPSTGTVNFFKSGGGCGNTGEIAGVFLHEWGHGLDQNDGGGTDNPGEAYGDITALMSTHVSCVGRGFYASPPSNCSGYGNACLNCTGIRDQDWNKRANHAPSTVSVFIPTCNSGSGPCGREVHCEGYLAGETLWDLANRDLPASGMDTATAWQLADKLWYKSRNGSGGNAYACSTATPQTNGCAANAWFSMLRVADDDDGNLANGTPHAAAIFAAFNRHTIACGLATDASNQNSSSCPALAAPALATTPGSSSAALTWNPVPNAVTYRVLRTDAGCDTASTTIATPATTNYTDSGLANGFTEYYHVQAMGSNPACEGVLSNCQAVTPQPFAGTIKLDASTYNCSATIHITVTDGNVAGATTSINIKSGTEPAGETVTLSQTGVATYTGSIVVTSAAPGSDGLLSVTSGDTITATYVDADDGQGGTNVPRTTTADADCNAPTISNVQSSNVTGQSARITWATNESSDSVVHYGLAPPPGSTSGNPAPVSAHQIDLLGLQECTPYVFSVSSTDGVGNAASDNNGGAYYGFTTLKNMQFNYPSPDTPKPIPDLTTTNSALVVADNRIIQDVNVKVNLNHTYDSDLAIKLIGPNNVVVNLSLNNGGPGDDYIDTVFDDQASTPIASGAPPFTGSFIPQQPLSVFNGLQGNGTWTLRVIDSVGGDSGTLNSWSLSLTYPNQPCGPHAIYNFNAPIADTCGSGGAGNDNLIWEAGETVQFRVNLMNDGTAPLTGVTATLVPTTPGVTMVNATASYPAIAVGASADSNAPHFTAKLATNLPCGSPVSFQVNIHANEGSWTGSFNHTVGAIVFAIDTALQEDFSGGIPATWTVVDGGTGGLAGANTWTTANPGARSPAPPISNPFAIVDSDKAGTGAIQDEQLITPAMDLTTATSAQLEFDQWFKWWSGGNAELGDVDVRSSLSGGNWVNVYRTPQNNVPAACDGTTCSTADHRVLDITAQAAGASSVQIRYHYYNGAYEWWWEVDNVKVTYTEPTGCTQTVCSAAPTSVKPVPDGSFGTSFKATRNDAAGTQIGVTWDVSTCVSTGYHILYGNLASVASLTPTGSACGIGVSGSYSWTGVPAGNLWYVIAADDGATNEGSWGLTSSGERGGGSASGQCSMATRDNSGSCP
ncbi:MAG TPA: proprotein convertase P-domain-containing protein [Candidatus Polarisedimenticolaceae bacterium]|nr:proprotein convertase P-domain-containing protein [Candidatus Polarisedimenticolaceae bacterium]